LRFLAKFSDRRQDRGVNRVASILRTPSVALERFDHEPGVAHRDPEQERAATHAINFVETGSFRLRVGAGAREWQNVTARRLFVSQPGLEFSCQHEHEHPDDTCLSVRFTEQAIESLRASGAEPLDAGVRALTNRCAYLKLKLGEAAGADPARSEALAGAIYWALSRPTAPKPLFRANQLSWYASRVDRAKGLMRAQYAEPLPLSRMAEEAGMSLYHFARVFHELEGQTPHRHLLEVRLAEASARLRQGASVTETCFAVGFGSLSHFTSSYKARFGKRPSDA
jgi:AraC-like DNA-binding protein